MNFVVSEADFTEIGSDESKWNTLSFFSDNGLAPNRRQAILWTNEDIC